jgi:FAD/FMN-containing dehydrogenase
MNKNLCSVQVIDDKRAKSGKAIRAAGGAVWAEIDRVGMQHGLATTSCDYAQSGAVGSGLTGGYGFLCGQHGLAVDNVLELEIVTADGRVEKVNEKDNSELFYACRGAAPALGCITNVTLAAFKQDSKVFLAALSYPRSKIQEVSDALRKWHKQCGEKEAVVLAIHQPRDAQEPVLTAHCFYNSNDSNVDQSLKKFEALVQAGPSKTEKGLKPFEEANKVLSMYVPHQQNESMRIAQAASLCTSTHNKNVKGVTDAFTEMVQRNEEFRDSAILIDLFPTEARRNSGKNDCAFGGRYDIHNCNIIIQYQEAFKDREANEIARRVADLFEQLDQSPSHLEGAPRYAGYDSNLSGKEALGSHYERVRKVKGRYDPENVFNRWIKVEPQA